MTEILEKMDALGLGGLLRDMAKDGQLLTLRCEMPTCYCPEGRSHFVGVEQPMPKWAPNHEHYPLLAMHGGQRTRDNVRLSHTWCNLRDQSFRKVVGPLLNDGTSLAEIAAVLNRRKFEAPSTYGKWTARLVRSTYVK